MNDLELLTTKRGMTFGKAWMLILFTVLSMLFAGMLVGFLSAMFNIDPSRYSTVLLVSVLFILVTVIAIIWGYFINLRELPFFRKQNMEVVVLCIISAFLMRFLVSVFEEIPISMFDAGATKKMFNEHLINLLSLTGVLTLQIGIIAHGLFRNYPFKKATITVLILSVIQMEPRSIISLACISLLLLIVYYRTGGFQLIIMMVLIYAGAEYFLSLFYDFDVTARNNYRRILVGDDVLYFSLLGIGSLAVIWTVARIGKLSKPFHWQRDNEYPAF